jgi:hypothetical protein
MNIKSKFNVIICILLLFLYLFCFTGQGIIAPNEIEVQLARGAGIQRQIQIYNYRNYASNYSLDITGEAANWITLYKSLDENKTPIDVIIVAATNYSEHITVDIQVPSYIASGNYTATIFTHEITGGNVVIEYSSTILIEVAGEQNLNGTISSVTVGGTTGKIETGDPLSIQVEFTNTGNVIAKPEIQIEIIKNNVIVTNFTYSETSVDISDKTLITVEWDSSGREPGNYTANVIVILGEKIVHNESATFTIVPYGELSRNIEFLSLAYEGEPKVEGTLKISAEIKNTGEAPVTAGFIGEVYKNEEFYSNIASEKLIVPARTSESLISYFTIETPGKYTVEGYVIYGDQKTKTVSISFEVGSTNINLTAIVGTSALAIIGLVLVGYLIKRKNLVARLKKRKSPIKARAKGDRSVERKKIAESLFYGKKLSKAETKSSKKKAKKKAKLSDKQAKGISLGKKIKKWGGKVKKRKKFKTKIKKRKKTGD